MQIILPEARRLPRRVPSTQACHPFWANDFTKVARSGLSMESFFVMSTNLFYEMHLMPRLLRLHFVCVSNGLVNLCILFHQKIINFTSTWL